MTEIDHAAANPKSVYAKYGVSESKLSELKVSHAHRLIRIQKRNHNNEEYKMLEVVVVAEKKNTKEAQKITNLLFISAIAVKVSGRIHRCVSSKTYKTSTHVHKRTRATTLGARVCFYLLFLFVVLLLTSALLFRLC